MNSKLKVNNLKVSFRTINGTLQAVRNISFELFEGETLSIVGESGSGKSVTSRAILGILANNKIIEGGEILYEGNDLLKLSEKNFHQIRGNKISMIFQDPMSSLNPIMRIGKQITEAIILKNVSHRKEAKDIFDLKIKAFKKYLDPKDYKYFEDNFLKVINVSVKLEKEYNLFIQNIESALFNLDILREDLVDSKNLKYNLNLLKQLFQIVLKTKHSIILPGSSEKYCNIINELKSLQKFIETNEEKQVLEIICNLKDILNECLNYPKPSFLAYAYCLKQNKDFLKEITADNILDYNQKAINAYNEHLIKIENMIAKAINKNQDCIKEYMKNALNVLNKNKNYFASDKYKYLEFFKIEREFKKSLIKCFDSLSLNMISYDKFFISSLKREFSNYYIGQKTNHKKEKKYQKAILKSQHKKNLTVHDKIKKPFIYDLDQIRKNIDLLFEKIITTYLNKIQENDNDYQNQAHNLLLFLQEKALKSLSFISKFKAKVDALKLLKEVGISEPNKRFKQYPFQFSGGMRQRIVIAIALAANPDILICDEPTTALDVTIQAQILELINKLKKERNLSIIFITHDLGVVANMADRIAVMYAGKIVETGTVEDIFYDPRHPYTWALLSSMPDLETKVKLEAIPGTPPNMIYPPKGDAFAERNRYALKIDFEQEPPLFKISETHFAATWLQHPNAPQVNPPDIILKRIEDIKKRREANHE